MSFESTQAENRASALQNLKFKKLARQARVNGTHPSDVTVTSESSKSTYQAPAQSRDGTAHPPYFASTTPRNHVGSILAPDSSPSSALPPVSSHLDVTYRPHQSHFFTSVIPSGHQLPSLPRFRREPDPLSAPSGFTRSTQFAKVSDPRPLVTSKLGKHLEDDDDDPGPPRKRINRGNSSANPISIEGFPNIKEPFSTAVNNHPPHADSSDSDNMPNPTDLLFGPTKSRLVRGRRPDMAQTDTVDSVELNTLVFTHPSHPRARVIRAFRLCDGDVKAATALIQDPTWNHDFPSGLAVTSPSSASATPSVSGSGGNKRAAEREKGKKSMIYAKRQGLSVSQVVVSPNEPPQSLFDPALSPLAPKPSRRKASKRRIDSSGSEAEYSDGHDSDSNEGVFSQNREDQYYQAEALKWLNECESGALVELTGIALQQAKTLISLRPFPDAADFNSKVSPRNKTGLSPRILEYCTDMFRGYKSVDDVLAGCERVGDQLKEVISKWSQNSVPTASTSKETTPFNDCDGALALGTLPGVEQRDCDSDYISTQPSLLADTVQLKEYQLLGVNWMNLLYQRNLSCILADEMGLGKTVQVIAFLALLKERRQKGPHLIVVPSSTLENWIREFDRFAPSIQVQAYYGSQKDRIELRSELRSQNWDVLVTTYNLAQGDERDRKFFRKFEWQCCIFDEGHVLKNFDSQRYGQLMKIESKWRLLLTGTPLQNNLQELVSLMNFILPRYFSDVINNLRAIFKVKADKHLSLLSRDRVSRAKKMMTPFVLRRRKDMVLKDLPKKTERIEWCEMTALQKAIYRDALQRSRKAVLDATTTPPSDTTTNGKVKQRPRNTKKSKDASANVLMDLRKAASHPMLFRRLFDDAAIKVMARQCMKEPEFSGSNYNFIVEDMEVMTDAELQAFSLKYKSTRQFAKESNCFEDAGKISMLLTLLDRYAEEGRRILIFSQFTQILDILQAILKHRKTKFLLLTGSTAVDVRQSLVDEFNEDESIPVFLLSTKAGGMGINLTAASVVVLFDQDFNPHNDRQAADRAYRIGQKRDVDVIKLITKSTIEEDMYRLGQTKLALDEAVAGDDTIDDDNDEKAEKRMKTSLLSVLREQFEKEELQQVGSRSDLVLATDDNMDVVEEPKREHDIIVIE